MKFLHGVQLSIQLVQVNNKMYQLTIRASLSRTMFIIGGAGSIISPAFPIKLHPEVLITANERPLGTLRHNRSHVPPIDLCSKIGVKLVEGSFLLIRLILVASNLKYLWYTFLEAADAGVSTVITTVLSPSRIGTV